MLLLIQYVLRVRPGGLVQAGIPCSSHVWMTRSDTGKSREFPHGHNDTEFCRDGNCVAARVAATLLICVVTRVFFSIEQPSSSVMPFLSYMRVLLRQSSGRSIRLQLVCKETAV